MFKIETLNKIEGNKEDLQEQINTMDKFVSELSQSLQADINFNRN